VGPKTAAKLRALGIERVVDVRTFDLKRLQSEVGSLAEWLRELSYGNDPRPVVPHRAAKSASSETTYEEDLEDLEEIKSEVARLARETAEWLGRKHLAGRTVTIKVRYADFTTITRSHTLSRPTSNPDVIASWATELLSRTHAGRRPVRLLGARVNGLVEDALLNL
jgi:DNA polymerase-4